MGALTKKKYNYNYSYKKTPTGGQGEKPNYRLYEDVGIRMGDEERAQYEKSLSEYNTARTEAQGGIASAQGLLDTAKSKLIHPDTAWNNYAKDFVPVRVYDSKTNNPGGDYWFPTEVIPELYKAYHDNGGNVNWNEGTGGLNIDTEGYGKETDEGLQQMWWDLHDSYWEKANTAYQVARNKIGGYQSQLDNSKKAMATSEEARLLAIANKKKAFDEKNKRTGSVLRGLKFGK